MHQLDPFVSERTIRHLHFAPIWEQLKPLTPLGEHKKANLRPFQPHEKLQWEQEMEHMRVFITLTDDRGKIALYVKGMVDISPCLRAWEQGIIPNRIDWFHIVHFLQKGWRVLTTPRWDYAWRLFPVGSKEQWRQLLEILTPQSRFEGDQESFQYEQLFPDLFAPLLHEIQQIEREQQKYRIERKARTEQELQFSLGLKNPFYISRKDEEKIQRLDAHPALMRVRETPFDIAYDWREDETDQNFVRKKEMCEFALQQAETRANEQLAERVLPYLNALLQWVDCFGRLDLLYAKAALAKTYNGVMPIWVDAEDGFELEGGIHPSLQQLWSKDGTEFTPVDISVNQSEVAVIIGPNMGGKSVALKTMGICTLLAHLGLWVPAQRFRFSPVQTIVYIGGDHEQVETGLSSFGGEMKQVADALRMNQGQPILALCDEIGRGTNPEEGEALAVALVMQLGKLPWFSCFVSHYGGVAELPNIRLYQIIGLSDLWDEGGGAATLPLSERMKRMDHRLQRVERGQVPKVAVTIARWMGIPEPVIAQATQWMEIKKRGESRS